MSRGLRYSVCHDDVETWHRRRSLQCYCLQPDTIVGGRTACTTAFYTPIYKSLSLSSIIKITPIIEAARRKRRCGSQEQTCCSQLIEVGVELLLCLGLDHGGRVNPNPNPTLTLTLTLTLTRRAERTEVARASYACERRPSPFCPGAVWRAGGCIAAAFARRSLG